jgi:hypothetical protein
MANNQAIPRALKDPLVPLKDLLDIGKIDEILRGIINGTPKEVHEAIRRVQEGWPGRKPYQIYRRFRWLKNCSLRSRNGNPRWRRAEWNEERIEMVRSFYAQGVSGARQAAKVMPDLYPGLTPQAIQRMPAKLGLTCHPGSRRPWSPNEDATLRWHAGMKPVSFLARKLNRSEPAVRQRLSRLGFSSAVREPNRLSLHRVSKILGVSDTIVRVWFKQGLFGDPNGHAGKRRNGKSCSKSLIRREALVAFCSAHPEKVNAERCDPEVLEWLEENNKQPGEWKGSRQHLTDQKECPHCSRVVIGNAYSRHVRSCSAGKPPPVRGGISNSKCDQSTSASAV